MLLRVRCGGVETCVEGKAALARLYRTRRVGPGDLVWHPVRARWMAVEAFLFLDGGRGPLGTPLDAASNGRAGSDALPR